MFWLCIAAEEMSTHLLGYHFWTIVYCFKDGILGDFNSINLGDRGIVFLQFDV